MSASDAPEPPAPPAAPTWPAPPGAPAPPDPLGQRAEPDFVPDRWRAGWGPAGSDAPDRRRVDRRQGDRREDLRRADDRWQRRDNAQAPEPPPLRVPVPAVVPSAAERALSPGRLMAVLVLIVVAFAGGIAVDEATFRGQPGATIPAGGPLPTSSLGPIATSRPTPALGATASPAASTPAGSGQPSPTPGPTIGPGATVPPNAPANIGLLWDALKIAQEHFVRRDQLNPSELTYGMINGLIESLNDPGHTVFLAPDQLKSENDALDGQIVGIGVYLGDDGGPPYIQSVISGSPAAKAGLRSGDQIIAIDGANAENLSLEEVSRLVRGAEGTPVTLTVLHVRSNSPLTVTIVRAKITVPAVTWTIIPGTSLADIQLSEFSSKAAEQFTSALRGAKQAGAQGIVLDLRNNPGGFVDEAVTAASQMLAEGVVYIRRTADGQQIPVKVKPGGVATTMPLSVLVDYGTASSGEILAGAIQAANRGPIIGTRTYGTGTVLNTFDLPDGSAVRVGVEEWLTPKGVAIFPNGIQPDIQVALPDATDPLDADTLRAMTADEVQASGDAQLLRAIQDLATR